jgi:catalase
MPRNKRPEVRESPPLSLLARPGDGSIRTRRVALLVADGVDGASLRAVHAALTKEGAVPRYVGPKLGSVEADDGEAIDVEVTLEAAPSVLFDAMVLPDGDAAVAALAAVGHTAEFIKDQYRHCKTILALGAGAQLLEKASIPRELVSGGEDPGVLVASGDAQIATRLVAAIAKHRHWERWTDPPRV